MERIDDCISFLSAKAAQTLARTSRERLARHGVTPLQFALLLALWERDGQNSTELCARLVLDSATITGVIDRVEKLGLIMRRPDADDRRVNRIHLTEFGRHKLGPLQSEMDAVNAEVAAHFGADTADLLRLLRRLAAFRPGRKEP